MKVSENEHTEYWKKTSVVDELIGKEGRPKIVCLCGSARFYEKFKQVNMWESLAGRIVLSIAADKTLETIFNLTESQGVLIRELHLRKIDLCDEILVLNVGGYIGETTGEQIKYAVKHSKGIRFLEPIPDCFKLTEGEEDEP